MADDDMTFSPAHHAQLAEDVDKLREYIQRRELADDVSISFEDGAATVRIHGFKFPPGFDHDQTDVLLKWQYGYPFAMPDGFWTSDFLWRDNGGWPTNTHKPEFQLSETPKEAKQRWWWCLYAWNPAKDNLITFVNVIRLGLQKAYFI